MDVINRVFSAYHDDSKILQGLYKQQSSRIVRGGFLMFPFLFVVALFLYLFDKEYNIFIAIVCEFSFLLLWFYAERTLADKVKCKFPPPVRRKLQRMRYRLFKESIENKRLSSKGVEGLIPLLEMDEAVIKEKVLSNRLLQQIIPFALSIAVLAFKEGSLNWTAILWVVAVIVASWVYFRVFPTEIVKSKELQYFLKLYSREGVVIAKYMP